MAICGNSNWLSGLLRVFGITGVLAHVIFCTENHALAQITPDGTLGDRSSRITPNVNIKGLPADRIDGGAIRGANLFHSFQEFNVGELQRVYFANPTGISNILTRVTGSNVSNILGTLGVNGGANLFFLNPNGIIFGQNARLDVSGSFIATTANSFVFGKELEFSATNPQTPSALLTVNPSALFFNQLPAGSIENRSIAQAEIGLQVPDGKSLLLVGGNVSMDGGKLTAYGGRVELGGLAAPGNVNLLFNGDNLSLKFPLNVTRADISLNNQAAIDVTGSGSGGGDIAINARNLEILGGSVLSGGILGFATPETVAGDITLNATGDIKIAGDSYIYSIVVGSVGKGGNIDINAANLSLTDGAQLLAETFGQGNAGNVNVKITGAVDIAGVKNYPSGIFSAVNRGTVGNGGNITIDSGDFSLQDGAKFTASTSGVGNAGNVTVSAKDAVDLAGNSYIFSTVGAGGVGKGGNIDINAATLSLTDGAKVEASTYGQGNAGNVTVSAKNAVDLAGNSYIFSTVEARSVGKGGNIDINAATLSLTDGAVLLTITRGASATQPAGRGDAGNVNVKVTGAVDIAGEKNGFPSGILSNVGTGTVGNGGNITIDSGDFSLEDGAEINASTYGQGNAGNVTVDAKNAVSLADAGILSTLEAGGVGKGGNIDINAATLSLTDGAQLLTATLAASATQPAGRGNAGNVNVKVTGAVDIAGEKNGFSSGIRSLVQTGTVGNGGNIFIDSGDFSLQDGAQLNASTFGQGNAGNVTVGAKDAVDLADNAYIFSTVEAGGVGKGGNIDINAATLSLTDGAQLLTATRAASATQPAGRGDAGNVNVKVTGAVDIAGVKNYPSGIFSAVNRGTVGNGGNITIDSGDFSLQDGAKFTASTSGVGNAGNVTVSAKDAVDLAGNSYIFSTVEAGGVGKGGNIDINAATLSLTDGAQLLTATRGASATQPAGRGDAGNVNVKVTGAVDIAGEKNGLLSAIASSVETGTVGNGGNITIDSGDFSLQDGAKLTASTSGVGNAGNVTVNAKNAVSLAGQPTAILSAVEAGGVGKGGNIDINATSLSLADGAELAASTHGQGNAGNILVDATDSVELSGVASFPVLEDGRAGGFSSGLFTSTDKGASGQGGELEVTTGILHVSDGAVLGARSQSGFKGGNITVNANVLEVIGGGQFLTTAFNSGDAGNITVKVKDRITISGSDSTFSDRFNSVAKVFGEEQALATIDPVGPQAGLFANTATGSSGNGGSIFIDPMRLAIADGAGVAVNSQGTGNGGSLQVQAGFLTLDNKAFLSAIANSGQGGNIALTVQDMLLLRRNSQISTTAGNDEFGGNGGNININSKFIVAVPNENSDISANAFTGIGGRVDITTNGLFGIVPQKSPTEKSDITASSQLGVSGTVTINTPDVDPSRGLIQLPSNVVDVSQQIAQGCTPRRGKNASRFIATGRGGLPQSPNEPLRGRAVITGWVDLPPQVTERVTDKLAVEITDKKPTTSVTKSTNQIVEAQGWIVDANGDIILVAQSGQSSSIPSAISCSQ
ncbi:two-partner secretion domain-containing protein [Nostoc sp.]|uniref:two-partner secretion domain-containing protein n=1 Tax=Nostoc sp. TaxID=1180 RepID=UPI002FF60A12